MHSRLRPLARLIKSSGRLRWYGSLLGRSGLDMLRATSDRWSLLVALLACSTTATRRKTRWIRRPSGQRVPIRDFSHLFVFREVFVDRLYDEAIRRVPAGSRVIDVGANVGMFCLRVKELVPSAAIHAFEPEPANHRDAEQALWGLTDVRIERAAVGPSVGQGVLYVHASSVHHSMNPAKTGALGRPHEYTLSTPVTDLHRILDGGEIDLLKLDCEGAEYDIVQSITGDIGRRIRSIVAEVEPTLYDPGDLTGHLRARGYAVELSGNILSAVRADTGSGR